MSMIVFVFSFFNNGGIKAEQKFMKARDSFQRFLIKPIKIFCHTNHPTVMSGQKTLTSLCKNVSPVILLTVHYNTCHLRGV